MTTMTLTLGGPITRAERDALPDDGRRHELIDGAVLVTPAPRPRHQVAVGGLGDRLRASCPPGLVAIPGPVDVVLTEDTVVQPDFLVARATDFTERDLAGAPLLAIEVLSPSTRLIDLNLKRARYEEAGCPSYWVFDPEQLELTGWESGEDGRDRSAVVVTGDQVFRTTRPYPVEIVPSQVMR